MTQEPFACDVVAHVRFCAVCVCQHGKSKPGAAVDSSPVRRAEPAGALPGQQVRPPPDPSNYGAQCCRRRKGQCEALALVLHAGQMQLHKTRMDVSCSSMARLLRAKIPCAGNQQSRGLEIPDPAQSLSPGGHVARRGQIVILPSITAHSNHQMCIHFDVVPLAC